jgi:hypothetical protein
MRCIGIYSADEDFMPRDYSVNVSRAAVPLIQEFGKDVDPKAYTFGKARESHAKGDMGEAKQWAEIANAVDLALADIEMPEHMPTALN